MIKTVRESIAMPQVGQVRKGAPKTAEGHVGKDLKDKFRVIFNDGEENVRSMQVFMELYGTLTPERISFIFPMASPFDCWENWYMGYAGGRAVAKSDGERFMRLVDLNPSSPAYRRVIVNNWKPETPYEHGMVIGQYRNGKSGKMEDVKCRATGWLEILLPQLNRMATFIVHTTSIYDIMRINQQLGALQAVATYGANGRGVVGIPLTLTRRETRVAWTQPDGTVKRVPHWLLNIEADPEWFEKMLSRMQRFSMPDGTAEFIAGALAPAPKDIHLNIAPEDLDQAEQESMQGDPDLNEDESDSFSEPDAAESHEREYETPICAFCRMPEPDHDPTCQLVKSALQNYFKICYDQLHWDREKAVQFAHARKDNYVTALADARKLLTAR